MHRARMFRTLKAGCPKGSPPPDPANLISTEEPIAKFHHNAEGVVSRSAADAIVNASMELDRECDVAMLMALTAHAPSA